MTKANIEAAVKNRLQTSNFYTLRHISCQFDGDTLTLGGRVSSFHEKQVAQSLVLEQLRSPFALVNQLEVVAS